MQVSSWQCRAVSWLTPVLAVGALVLSAVSCNDTTLGNVDDNPTDADTIVIQDTLWLAEGTPDQILFGMVYDLSWLLSSATKTFDTVYAGLTSFSRPIRSDLSVSVNKEPLDRVPNQPGYIVSSAVSAIPEGSFQFINMLALVPGALYEGFVPQKSSYLFRTVTPVYTNSTIDSYDTLKTTVTVPSPINTIILASADSVYTQQFDSSAMLPFTVIDTSADLLLTWNGDADYYAVFAVKIMFSANSQATVGETIDTFVTDTSFSIASEWFSAAAGGEWSIVEVDYVPINGPAPSAWDTLPSFGSRGLVMGMRSDYSVTYLFGPEDASLAKRARTRRPEKSSGLEIFNRVVGAVQE